jgi:hypothetical protein
MVMRSLPLLSIISIIALVAGCHLEAGGKDACNALSDCLSGYVCVDHACVDRTDSSPDARGEFYGSVEPLAPQSAGISAGNSRTLVAVTTAPATLGCAVVGDLQASPGSDTAVVYATVRSESGDARCPTGVFAIMNNASLCRPPVFGELYPGCALYKRWDAAGQQAAYQLAIGGYVSIARTYLSDMAYRCDAELSISFAGGAVVAKTWTFQYNPYAAGAAFCVH